MRLHISIHELVLFGFPTGKIILEAFILTGAAVAGLTLYTFWAVKRGKDFSFLGPFLSASLLVLIVFGIFMVSTFSLSHLTFTQSLPNMLSPLSYSDQCTNISHFTVLFPCGKDSTYDIRPHGSHHILWLHRVRHKQLDQALHIWWIHHGCNRTLLGHRQHLHCIPPNARSHRLNPTRIALLIFT